MPRARVTALSLALFFSLGCIPVAQADIPAIPSHSSQELPPEFPEDLAQNSVENLAAEIPPGPTVTRWAGLNRYETAAHTAQIGREAAPHSPSDIVIVNGKNFPDALAAGPWAARTGKKLLLASGAWPDANLQATLPKLHPESITLLGGPGALSRQLETELAKLTGVTPTRIAGKDRYDTAGKLAATWGNTSTVLLASGENYPDAVSAGGAAAKLGAPLLLTPNQGLSAHTKAALQSLKPGTVFIVGGAAALNDQVITQVQAVLPGVKTARISGPDRFATSAEVAKALWPAAPVTPGKEASVDAQATAGTPSTPGNAPGVIVTTGKNFPDAISAIGPATAWNAPILLGKADCLPESVYAQIQALAPSRLGLVGGSGAIADNAWTKTCPKAAPAQIQLPHESSEATGCAPSQAAARSQMPADQRPWCPAGDYHGPVTQITPVSGGRVIFPGWNGVKVSILQYHLGLGSRWETYDAATVAAVQRRQAQAGLPANGIVDPATWQALGVPWPWDIDAWQAPVTVAPTATRAQRVEQMIAFAYSKLNLPYTWGGAGDGGLGYDCSGLILQALYTAGVDPQPIDVLKHAEPLYRSSQEFYRDPRLQKVPFAARQRGDILFYTARNGVIVHVALYLGNNLILEALPPKVIVRAMPQLNPGPLLPVVVRPIADDRG